jgi:urea transporter/murein DD-endopeptidase MepM/ murein hydrolase activator NlpD
MIFTDSYQGNGEGVIADVRRTVAGVFSAYSGILFVDQPIIGIAFLASTFWYPNVGLAGLVGALVGMAVGYLLKLPYPTSGVNVYSSLLVGLSLGAYYVLTPNLLLLIVLCAALTVFLAATLRSFLWQLGHLPVLSLPFVIVALTAALAASTYGGLVPYFEPAQLPPPLFGDGNFAGAWLDSFFAALGSIFFSPHPFVGALLFAGVLLRSRFLAFLCLAGFLSGQFVFVTLMAEPPPGLLAWTGFNFSLTAMALGGIFGVPSVSSFVVAMLGAAASAVVSAALSRYLLIYNLPVMALPFLLTTLTLLAALRLRVSTSPPILLLEQPGLPETNYERARLARSRLGELGSLPVVAPFLGSWQVYQGFDGPHTHRGQWRFALDFHRIENGRSFAGAGNRLEDFYCFGLPVLSPVYGFVVEVKDSLPDNPPGELDLTNNWGNHVLIQTASGLFVLLAHLRQGSVKVTEGASVTPNTPVASCGNSGRSPQPHLHLQVQRHAGLGGATVPFHLVSSIVSEEHAPPRYDVVVRSLEVGSSVERADEDPGLAGALQLAVGRELEYQFTAFDGSTTVEQLSVDVSLLGQYRVSTGRASAAFERRNGTLAFYDRQGPASPFLDAWLLTFGLTPLSAAPKSWSDAPPARLLPLARWERVALALLRPLGTGLASSYERIWSDADETFVQRGRHKLEVAGLGREITSEGVLSPGEGCVRFTVALDGRSATAQLSQVRQRADAGVPAWERRSTTQ